MMVSAPTAGQHAEEDEYPPCELVPSPTVEIAIDECPPDEEQDAYDTSYPELVPDDEYPYDPERREQGFYDTLFPSTELVDTEVTISDVEQAYSSSRLAETETECTELPTADRDTLSEPIYSGAQLTLGLSLILIMSFAINHNLTDSAVQDLLQLINLHCLTPNLCVTTLYMLKKHFSSTQFSSTRHYYCRFCKTTINNFDLVCPNTACGRSAGTKPSYFLELSIADQLRNMFKRPKFFGKLQHRFSRTKPPRLSEIEDVYDGQLYCDLMKPGEFLANLRNISFQLNTDGVALFHSSNFGIWPIYHKINELPLEKRSILKNKILAAIWLGETHPVVNTFFKPIYETMLELFRDGIKSNHQMWMVNLLVEPFCSQVPVICRLKPTATMASTAVQSVSNLEPPQKPPGDTSTRFRTLLRTQLALFEPWRA